MTGNTLSHYRIVSEVGRGGMGIVYLGEDTKLGRKVAIKVLPSSALASEDDRARFYREAKAAAALNHPNIAQIYQIDEAVPSDAPHGTQPSPFIAMEYIDGEPLEARIKRGPMKLAEAVRLATQIAGALGEAHEKGIVHRDVKASNVMLTSKGDAKVLDFGLALTAASTKLTRMGSTLGTVAYMSPEQARGEEVDRRTDLWALGVVLYEMVAGRNPFGGDYEQAVVYSILNTEPEPLTAVRTGVPMELERIAYKALAKDRDLRYQTAADLIADLKAIDAGRTTGSRHVTAAHSVASSAVSAQGVPAQVSAQATKAASMPSVRILAVAAVMLLALGALLAWLLIPGAPEPRPEKLLLEMEGMRHISNVGLSPDSRYIAMTGYDWDGREGLFLFDTQEGTISHVERSEGASYPWFSPSGSFLAFTGGQGDLNVMDVPHGTPRSLLTNTWTSYWLDEDRILFTARAGELRNEDPDEVRDHRGPNYIYSISSDSAQIVSGTERALEDAEWFFPGPRIPGSRLSIGNIQGAGSFGLDPRLYILDTDKGSIVETDIGGINAQVLTPDILIYQLGDDAGKLVARRIDPRTGEFRSPPMDLLERTFFARFQAEPNSGSLVFTPDYLPDRQLVSVLDLESDELSTYEIAGANGEVAGIVMSPDGTELVGTSTSGETGLSRIVTVDLETEQIVVRAEGVSYFGLRSLPGGRLLGLAYDRENGRISTDKRLIVQNLTTGRSADTLTAAHEGLRFTGRFDDGYVVGIDGEVGWLEADGERFTPFVAGSPTDVSPDGRYISYVNSAGVMAVYDRRTEDVTELSGLRGFDPEWSPDGRYLYFFSFDHVPPNTSDEAELVRLPIRLDNGFEALGEPEFVLYVWQPISLSVGAGRIAVWSLSDISQARPTQRSVRVWWWRDIGSKMDEILPR